MPNAVQQLETTDDALPSQIDASAIHLDTPGTCHVVIEGEINLFAVRPDQGAARHGLGRIGKGGVLFGIAPSFLGEETLLAIASPNARIYQLPAGSWRAGEPMEAFGKGVAAWLGMFAHGLGQAIEPKPRPDIAFSGGHEALHLPANCVIGCSDGVVWIDLPAGGAQLFGMEPVQGLIPLPAGAWLTLDGAGDVRALGWDEGLARADWPEALDAFNLAAAELLPIVRGFTEADEFNRIRSRKSAEELDAQQVAGRFADILDNTTPVPQEADSDGLMDVLRILGRELEVTIKRPLKSRRAQMDLAPTLDEIARASDLRMQTVGLEGDWWRSEAGALLGKRRNGEPLALLWRGHYEELDRTGKKRKVTADVARELEPVAQLLFKPQPVKLSFVNLTLASLRRSGGDIAGLVATIIIGSAVGQLLPMATSLVFGVLVPAAMQNALMQIGILIVLVGIAGFVVHIAGDVAKQRVNARADEAIFRQTWDRITALPLSALRKYSSAEISARSGAGLSVLTGVRQFAFTTSATLGLVLSSLWVIAWSSPLLAALAAALMTLHIGIGLLAGWLQARAYINGEQLMGTADSQMVQIVNGMTKLRSAAAEERAVMRWADRFSAMRSRLVASRRVMNLYESWLAAFPILGSAALFAVVQAMSSTEEGAVPLSMAAVVAVITAFATMFISVGQFLRAILAVWLQKPSWSYAKGLLEQAPEATVGLSDPGPLGGEIEFAAVGFQYEGGTSVLSNVSFRAAPGEMIAVVGPSGSGKSTLVRLLLGIEQPDNGAIYIDGHDIRSLHPGALRGQIGVVLQDDKLPPGTILDVVRGITNASPDDVWKALDAAAMAQEVAAMPLGLHTVLMDAGRVLSGGQVQRLSLARAFLSRPPILVLDEATSALDNGTQARAMATVLSMAATRFVIAHRISTIRHAHRILMLDNGRIVESGTFAELMAKQGAFARLASAQA